MLLIKSVCVCVCVCMCVLAGTCVNVFVCVCLCVYCSEVEHSCRFFFSYIYNEK